jgi:hypothetical protein
LVFKAAELGNASAQSNLGEMYIKGEGVPKDLVIAYARRNQTHSNSKSIFIPTLIAIPKALPALAFSQKNQPLTM